jgi:hypothetical protein
MFPNKIANFFLTTEVIGTLFSFSSYPQQMTLNVTTIIVLGNLAPLGNVFCNLFSSAVQKNIRSLGYCLG